MSQLIRPAIVRVVPRDGELEITVNINITVDGKVTASAEGVSALQVEKEKEAEPLIPEFGSGFKINFGKS